MSFTPLIKVCCSLCRFRGDTPVTCCLHNLYHPLRPPYLHLDLGLNLYILFVLFIYIWTLDWTSTYILFVLFIDIWTLDWTSISSSSSLSSSGPWTGPLYPFLPSYLHLDLGLNLNFLFKSSSSLSTSGPRTEPPYPLHLPYLHVDLELNRHILYILFIYTSGPWTEPQYPLQIFILLIYI